MSTLAALLHLAVLCALPVSTRSAPVGTAATFAVSEFDAELDQALRVIDEADAAVNRGMMIKSTLLAPRAHPRLPTAASPARSTLHLRSASAAIASTPPVCGGTNPFKYDPRCCHADGVMRKRSDCDACSCGRKECCPKWMTCSIKEAAAPPTVTSHGCYAESFPPAFKPAHEGQGTIWRTHSPVECACMCKLRYGMDWAGFVAIRSDGSCSCLESSSQYWKTEDGVHDGPKGWGRRGAMPSRCCMEYSAKSQSLVSRARGVGLGCTDVKRTDQNDPGWAARRAKGQQWHYDWVQSIFEVTLCKGVCGTSRVPGGECAARFTTQSWAGYSLCATGEGAHYHCGIPGGGVTSKIRLGSRTSDGMHDAVVSVVGTARPYRPRLAQMWQKREGFDCSFTSLLKGTEKKSKKRALDFWAEPLTETTTSATWQGQVDFANFPPAKAATLVKNSLVWMCENGAMMAHKSFQCWRKLGAGEKMKQDCTPPEGSAAPQITRDVRACAKRTKQETTRAARATIGRAFVAFITSRLETEIVANMKGFCPDLKALRDCVAGLLPEPRKTLPQNRHFVLPPGHPGTSNGDAVAFLIPYRERPMELRKWLWWTLPLLLTPKADGLIQPFGIFVAEEINGPLWNKARILNAATREVRALSSKYECLLFIDVDLVMQAPKSALSKGLCLYGCNREKPLHYSSLLLGYEKPYDAGPTQGVFCGDTCSGPPKYRGGQSSGGVNAITFSQFTKIDGWTNAVWGWGGEDGDFDVRIKANFADAPIELPYSSAGNDKCVFVHLIDRDSDSKGEIGMQIAAKKTRGKSGFKEVGQLYKLLRTEWNALYTTFVIDPLQGVAALKKEQVA